MCYSVLQTGAARKEMPPPMSCNVMQRGAVCCSVLQYVAVCCSVLQCVAVCCSVLQCVAECCGPERRGRRYRLQTRVLTPPQYPATHMSDTQLSESNGLVSLYIDESCHGI